MARFSLDEGTSGSKRRNTRAEEEEASKKRRVPSGCGTSTAEAEAEVEVEEEEESEDEEEASEEEDGDGEKCDDDADEATDMGDSSGIKRDRELSFRIDPDVLECSICCEPLRPPIFQCRNGHTACSTCCPKLSKKCHVCSRDIGHRRCLALEKVIESIVTKCQYACYGCRATLSFLEKSSHEEMCSHAALFCPIRHCTFSGSKQLLSTHIKNNHSNIVKNFSYDRPFMLTLKWQEPFLVLLGEDDHVFLLLKNDDISCGKALSMIGIIPNGVKFEFSYALWVHGSGSSLHLRASAEKMRKWSGIHPSKNFLVVPKNFYYINGIHVDVCIQKSSEIPM
ncbi:E3 ubiquitin-protein ligase SINA-like 10 [Apostasia shenzhenica]|uniref:RING-type E3 ubiquitin transferase n=1 Tax=Apostasia shenzhenica TaxID=1088818 RepID=A0A2I0A140_9ASPA|nr:E3 ubiquitin-protein ligase SINA-like 10 [Apostasia shenzhenica]